MSKEFGACLPDWTIRRPGLADQPPAGIAETSIWTDEQGLLELSRLDDDSRYRLRLADQVIVDIDLDERLVRAQSASLSALPSTREHFLIDQVLPRILGHQGSLVLHAAAVRVGAEAILLLGKSGSGKSTLTADFDQAGFALLGDDALIVSWPSQTPHVRAVYPSLRLFPDSIEALFDDGVATASVAHYTPKLRVSVPLKDGSENGTLPVGAIFVLSPPSLDFEILVKRKSVAKACMAMVEDSFVLDPTDTARASGRLHKASRLAAEVPTFDLCYPRAYSRLADVRAAILEALDQPA